MSVSTQETAMWKVEPLSPSGTPPPLDFDTEWLYFDQKPVILETNELKEFDLYEKEQLSRSQVASKLLEELELKEWVKEESFVDWFEEKIDIPIFEELPAPECGQNRAVIYSNLSKPQSPPVIIQQHQQQQQVLIHQPQHVDATQSLLQEFETVLGDVEACHQITSMVSTLTPPQSPPPLINHQQQHHISMAPQTHLLVSLQPLEHQTQATFLYEQHHQEPLAAIPLAQQEQQQQQANGYTLSNLPNIQQQQQQSLDHQIVEHWNAENLSLVPLVHGSEVAHELAKVDEYVRSCAADVVVARCSTENQHHSSSASSASVISSAPPSPCTSSNASCISSEDSTDDPDWSFEPSSSSSSSSSSSRRTSRNGRASRKTASKPYSRHNTEDKRVRKKEQNKNAATRYRQKKKQEVKEILVEECELVEKNEKLQNQFKDLQREIGYLKNLMRDLFKAKGLLK